MNVPEPRTNTVEFDSDKFEAQDTEKQQDPSFKKFVESDAGDGTKREDQYLHGVKLLLCFISLVLCMLLISLDQTITNTIIPIVGNKFHAFDKVAWLSSGFILAQAVCLQPYGRISILWGRKYTMLSGILLFEAGSLMCALANSMGVLIGGRVLAGVGAAGTQGMVLVIISEILPIEKRPMGMAVMASMLAIASCLGPVIGGLFTTHVTWRWAFYINLPIGGVAATVFFFTFSPPPPKGNSWKKFKEFDFLGTLLMISGIVIFLLAMTFGGNNFKWSSSTVIVCFVIGGLLIIAFCVWNFGYSKQPLIPQEIIAIPQVVASICLSSGAFAYFIASLIYLAVYFQVVLGKSALSSGLHLLPTLIAMIICSISSGIIVQKTKHLKELAVVAGVLSPIGAGLLCLLDIDTSFSKLVGLLIIPGIAIGTQMQPTVIGAQLSAPKTPGSTILTTSLVTFFRLFISAIAANLADVVYTTSLQRKFASALKNTTDQSILSQLNIVNGRQLASSNQFISELTPEAQIFVKKIIMASIRNVFYMCIGFTAFAVVGSIFMTNKRLPANSKKGGEPTKGDEEVS